MRRREFLKQSALGMASGSLMPAFANAAPEDNKRKKSQSNLSKTSTPSDQVYPAESQRLFPTKTPATKWVRLVANGFSQPACGIVYHRDNDIPHGMPLGGVATGFMDIDTDGTFGYFNLFNSAVPTRGPIEHGFLGIKSEERCWVLTTRDMTGTENALDIHYWGHYPVADLEYELDGPFSASETHPPRYPRNQSGQLVRD